VTARDTRFVTSGARFVLLFACRIVKQ
jgi:hypothetical protein